MVPNPLEVGFRKATTLANEVRSLLERAAVSSAPQPELEREMESTLTELESQTMRVEGSLESVPSVRRHIWSRFVNYYHSASSSFSQPRFTNRKVQQLVATCEGLRRELSKHMKFVYRNENERRERDELLRRHRKPGGEVHVDMSEEYIARERKALRDGHRMLDDTLDVAETSLFTLNQDGQMLKVQPQGRALRDRSRSRACVCAAASATKVARYWKLARALQFSDALNRETRRDRQNNRLQRHGAYGYCALLAGLLCTPLFPRRIVLTDAEGGDCLHWGGGGNTPFKLNSEPSPSKGARIS